MRVLKSLIVCTAFIFSGSEASAQTIDDDTKCATIELIMYAPSPDKQKVRGVLDYTLQTMQAVDRTHRLRGHIEIFPQMTGDGRTSVALIAVNRCRSHASITLADTAIETYEAIRTIRTSVGLNGQRRIWARTTLARNASRATALAARQAVQLARASIFEER
jgi:hypothetical protein